MSRARRCAPMLVLALSAPSAGCSEPTPAPATPPAPASARPGADSVEVLAEADAHRSLAAGQLEAALQAALFVFQRRQARLGPLDLDTCASLDFVAAVYEKKRDDVRAQQALEESLRRREAGFGPNHASLADVLDKLAALPSSTGRHAEVIGWLRRSLSVRETALGAWDPAVASSLLRLGQALRSACNDAEAEALYVRALAILERRYGAFGPELGGALVSLASLREAASDDARTEEYLARARVILERNEASHHPQLGHVLAWVAQRRADKKNEPEARALAERAVSVSQKWGDRSNAVQAVFVYETLGDDAAMRDVFARMGMVAWSQPASTRVPTPKVQCTPVSNSGNVANASQTVAGMASGFRRCYGRGLKADPSMRGSVRLMAKIDSVGAVRHVVVEPGGQGLPPDIVACVAQHVLSATFGPPDGGGATVVIPVSFAWR